MNWKKGHIAKFIFYDIVVVFQNIRDPFLEAVKITLGDRYTDNMESIYKVAITFILQTMVEGMEDALKNKAT